MFMTEEFAAGKNLLSGEYLLPSGLSINFGVMIGKLKRDKLLGDVMHVRACVQACMSFTALSVQVVVLHTARQRVGHVRPSA